MIPTSHVETPIIFLSQLRRFKKAPKLPACNVSRRSWSICMWSQFRALTTMLKRKH